MDQIRTQWHRASPALRKIFTKRRLIIAGASLAAIAILIPITTYAYYAQDIRNRERLMNHNNTGVALLDKNGEVFYSRGEVKNMEEVKLADISPWVQKALIASEDKNFMTDSGFSITGTARAFINNVKGGDLNESGGSGITQQLVKNNLLNSDKTYFRKYQELSMAIAIERHYGKDEILDMYLNSVFFGNNAFGIGPAANYYFDKPAKDLDLAESSMLIGLLPAPSAYSPVTGDEKLGKERQEYVLTRMVEEAYITEDDKDKALAQKLTYHTPEVEQNGIAHHFALMVLDDLYKQYGEERVVRSGFRVKTSLDTGWQKSAEAIVSQQIAALSAKGARNGSVVAIDTNTGEIRALVGSADWNNTEYGKVNMAMQPRQPGSSFKPIYYAKAIEDKKITAATILHDEPTDFGAGYRPTNYDFKYRGDVTVRNALANSLNIPAVEVMEKIGVSTAAETARKMGIDTVTEPEKYGLSLALGTAEAPLLDMTNAYAAFAENGKQFTPTTIAEIKDKFDRRVYSYTPKANQVASEGASYIMSSILSDERARFPLAGSAFNIGRPAAVKTGTTNDNRDAWTIGYTPQLAIGVWVGNNSNEPMQGVGGSLGAGPIWKATMTNFLNGVPKEEFAVPPTVTRATVCSGSQRLTEYFIVGTAQALECKQAPRQEEKQDKKEEKKQEENNDNSGRGNGNNEDQEEGGRGGGSEEPEEPTDDESDPDPEEEEPTEPTPEPVTPPSEEPNP
jgi:1A family penicillin-binding protein